MSTTAPSKIEWCRYTFNLWRGCTRVHEGCLNCYAEKMSARNPAVLGEWGPRGRRIIAAESYWRLPIRWNTEAHAAGERFRVFCASLADVFEGEDTMPAADRHKVGLARTRTPFFFKQTGANVVGLTVKGKGGDLQDIPKDLQIREFPA